jgi:uncharacterized delta-60 repeat protein/uncharacterized repeat protein (TIGR01451 family)
MRIFHERILKQAGGAVAALCAALALWVGSATDVHAQPAPPNDSVTNAQGIIGMSGTVAGTNLYAPVQTNAPAGDPFPAQYSVWYVWTAPTTAEMAFDTRSSVDVNGNPLATVLAVYQLKTGTNVTFKNMVVVATNASDLNTNYPNTSRVNFAATFGTMYLIQVDGSQANTPGTNAQGYIVLNWAPSLVAGGFGFSSTVFEAGSLDDYIAYNDSTGSINPSIYPPHTAGGNNVRLTVTRSGGYTGRCEVTLILTNNWYGNIYKTNYIGTNILTTNYTDSNMTSVVSYSNVFLSTTISENEFASDVGGVIQFVPVDNCVINYLTNWGPPSVTVQANQPVPFSTLGQVNFFTNFPCPNVIYNFTSNTINVDGSTNYLMTNSVQGAVAGSNVYTVTTTNIYCNHGYMTNALIPAAVNGVHYNAGSQTVVFRDFEMSKDIYVQVDPALASIVAAGGSIVDTPVPGPDSFSGDPNYNYQNLNASVSLILTNVVLDPGENPDIIPPAIIQSNADLSILDYWGSPSGTYTNGPETVINFERATFRVNRNCGTAILWVQRYPRCEPNASYTVHYTIDTKPANFGVSVLDWDQWETVAGSDYAVASTGQPVFDFTLPTTPDWGGVSGELTFPPCPNVSPQSIQIPIINNGSQEFDEDIYVELFETSGDAQNNGSATPLGVLGNIVDANLTINFDNTGDGLQPGGAVDRGWNVDSQNNSMPPGNPTPGATGGLSGELQESAVSAVAIQTNGEAIIGGSFNAYNIVPAYGIARLKTDGFLDTSFNTGTGLNDSGYISAMVIDSSGRVIIGGGFASFNNNYTVNNIARLNYDGSVDTTFNIGVGFNGPVSSLALDANGNILVGGDFTSFNTTNCNYITRLLPSGGLDRTFLPNTGNGSSSIGADAVVNSVALDSSGNVVLGGGFHHVDGSIENYVARLLPSGAVDTSFNPQIGPDNVVNSLAVTANNEIVIGGSFQNYNLVGSPGIALIAANGALDTGFNPGLGFDGPVYTVVIQPDGNILVGGQFTSFNTTRRIGLARLLPQGWLDTSFMDTSYNQFAGFFNDYFIDAPNTIYAMALQQADGNIIAGGSFSQVGGGYTRVDYHQRVNVARIIGASTVGYGAATSTYETGGIGNCPGNVTFTQNPYEALDTQAGLYITIQRTNGSLGPAMLTLGTNTLAPGSGAATAADFGLSVAVAEYDDLWDLTKNPNAGSYGWRKSDGYYGFNNAVQPKGDNGSSGLDLSIHNNLTANQNLYANLSLLNLNSYGLLTLGGVVIPTGPALGVPGTKLEILDNNMPIGVVGYSMTNYTTVNTSSNITITVLRTNGSSENISVYYWTKDGTARVAAGDYTPAFGRLSFGPGATSQTFTVPIGNFTTVQPTKYFNLYFSNAAPTNILAPSYLPTNSVVTIFDGNFTPGHLCFTFTGYNVTKGGQATVGVQRKGGVLGQLQVQCGTSDGTGVNGVNYIGVTNTLFWTNQDVGVKTVTFQTLQDNTVEGSRTVNVSLFGATNIGATSSNNLILASPSNAVVTIADSDFYGALNFVTPNFNVLQSAGQALITVNRTSGTTGTLTVNYTVFSDTNAALPYQPAIAGTNFGQTNGTLTFGAGVTSQSFGVPIYYTPAEASPANRMVTLELFNGSPAAMTNQTSLPIFATLTILDNQLVLDPAGNVDMPALAQSGAGFNSDVLSLALQPNGSVLAGGDFTFFNQYPFDFAARLNPDASFDNNFAFFNQAGANASVSQILSQPPNSTQTNGSIMIVGSFTQVDSVNRNSIARLNLDGSLDETFDPGAGANGPIYTLADIYLPAALSNQAPTLAYYVAGNFADYNGTACGAIARVNGSTNSLGHQGILDPNFNVGQGVTGSNGIIWAMGVQPNNQVVLGGDFTSFNGTTYNHLIRLNVDGSVDASFVAGTESDPSGSVRAIAVQPDGRILIGGLFTNVNGSNYNYLARLNSDGTLDTNFNVGVGGNNYVLAIALDSQQRILVGGTFSRFSGVTRNGITRLNPDGTVDPTINFQTGADGGYVDAIAIQTNDEIDVGGGFTNFEGVAANNFVRLYGGANFGEGTIQFTEQVYGVLQNGSNAVIALQRLGGEGTTALPTVSIVFSTSDGTAVAGTDYVGVTNTVTFPFGETFETVTIPIINNSVVSGNKILNLNLSSPLYAGIGVQASSELIITNINTAINFSAQSYSFDANVPGGNAIIPVERIGDTNTVASITVYTGTNGNATPNVTYIPQTNVLTFNPGVTNIDFLIPLLKATSVFDPQTVDLEMTGASNAFLGSPSSATLNIANIYSNSGVVSFLQTNYVVSEGVTNASIEIYRTNGNAGALTVTFTATNGSAVSGVNYLPVQTNITFGSGSYGPLFVSVPVIQQALAGPNTVVDMYLSNATDNNSSVPPGIGIGLATLTILNDIENFNFSESAASVNEGAGTVTIDVQRTGPSFNSASVSYSTYTPPNGTEAAGYAVPYVDYLPTSGTLNFISNETFATFPVTILQNSAVNPPLTFQVVLNNPLPAGVQVGVPATESINILCNVTGFDFPTNAYSVAENGSNLVVWVMRTNSDTGTASVQYFTSDGTAVSQTDYLATNGTLIFTNGQTSNSFTVPILNPNLVENNKQFNLTLTNAQVISTANIGFTNAYVVSPSNAVVTITNVLTGVSFGAASFTVSECSVQANIPVLLIGATNNLVTVNFATSDGSGVAGVNYFPTNIPITFQPGQTSTNIAVEVINNHIIGPDHTVNLTLSGALGAQLLTPSTAILTIQECNGAYIVKSGTAFVSGNLYPAGVIMPNETVTVLLGLRDVAGFNTSNLVATMLVTNGVTNVSAAQNYGALITNGPTVARPFTFTTVGTNGQNISATLTLRDGSEVYSNVSFGFTMGGSVATFTTNETLLLFGSNNPPSKASSTNAPNYGYPSTITVAGISGNVTAVTASLNNFGHTYPSDVAVALESPTGQTSYLMADCGGTNSVGHLTLTFSNGAPNSLPQLSALTSGTYLPTTYADPLMPPATGTQKIGPFATTLTNFVGQSPNGVWSLFVGDEEQLDSGYISNGWSLGISTGVPIEEDSDLEMVMLTTPSSSTISNQLVYTISVTNYGPAIATNVVVTDTLPLNVAYLTNGSSYTVTNNVLVYSAGTLAVSNGFTFSVTVVPNVLGYITNIAVASANQPDPNSNNVQSSVSLVGPQVADVGVTLSGTPNPVLDGATITYVVVVTNNGPSSAPGVTAVDTLPAGFRPSAITPTQGVAGNVNGTITWSVGTLGSLSNTTASLTIVAGVSLPESGLPAASLNSVTVSSQVYDPSKLNNYAAVKTQVDPAVISVVQSGNAYTLSWPANGINVLQGSVILPPTWVTIANSSVVPQVVAGVTNNTYAIPGTNGYHFFRLMSQLP